MLGLFGTLNLASESLQVQRQGVEVAGHNLANVNNPAYARQRVAIATAGTIPTAYGPQGTGAMVVQIRQIRDSILDGHLQTESSVRGYLEAQQRALQYGQANLGQSIDRTSESGNLQDAGGQHGIAEDLTELFNAFQSLATEPTSLVERQLVLDKAQNLAAQFNQVSARMAELKDSLNESVSADVTEVNRLLEEIAGYNKEIVAAEIQVPGSANDLRDLRQQRLEELAQLVNVHTVQQSSGAIDISISGVSFVSGADVVEKLQAYDGGNGNYLVRSEAGQTPITLTGGAIGGIIDARDGALKNLTDNLDKLANLLITEVNTLHRPGYNLNGGTGLDFFTGTGAANLQVNAQLRADPALLQGGGVAGATGDNQVALALAQLAAKQHASLNNKTFSQNFSQVVGELGEALHTVNGNIEDQSVVEEMLQRQRDSISGVSLDEEMTDLVKFQKAFQASARLVNVVDQMLQTVLSMGV